MKFAMLFIALVCGLSCFCEQEPPTFKSNPDQIGKHQTGRVEPAPLTIEQYKADQEFPKRAKEEGWTFRYNVRLIGARATGLRKPDFEHVAERRVDTSFRDEDIKIPAKFHLSEFGIELMGHYDQGSCGSCVYNSAMKGWTDNLRLHGLDVPVLSRSHVMNCTGGGQCSGEWMMNVAGYIANLDGVFAESVYPYRPVSASCNKRIDGEKYGKGLKIDFHEIDHSQKSMMTALLKGFPVHVTVGADGPWSSFAGGIYNGCTRAGTNHEILMYGWDCESAVEVIDGKSYCKFDAKGNLPPGVGFGIFPNSWGDYYGVNGDMISRFTDKRGNLCNNIAEEAVIMDSGLPVVPKEPLVQEVVVGHAKLKLTIQPKHISKKDEYLGKIKAAISIVEGK